MRKFIARSNLNRLAKKLRFLGYDTLCIRNIAWHNINRIASKDRRIILTRNQNESKRKDATYKVYYISTTKIDDQLKEIASLLEFNKEHLFTRCSICNTTLHKVQNTDFVRQKVPTTVYKTIQDFYTCHKCGRLYWQGSQTKDIETYLEEIVKA